MTILAAICLAAGFASGFALDKRHIRSAALDAAVREQCGREVPVVAVWHGDMEQVVYHFSPSLEQTRRRWCRGE